MKKTRHSESEIIKLLKLSEKGVPVPELCREYRISTSTFYSWRSKYGGMDVSMLRRVKDLEAENSRLKRLYAEERLASEVLREALEKEW